MSEPDDLLTEPFRRLLADLCTPAAVRLAERQPGVPPLWAEIEGSGFLDALVPAPQGGAGLSLADVFPLVAAAGEFALPVPFAETMVARALLAAQGSAAPSRAAIVLAPPSPIVPHAAAATHALLPADSGLALVELGAVGEDPFAAGGGVIGPGGTLVVTVAAAATDLLVAAAALTAARMAGAMGRALDLSLRYVQDRQQFGRPLAKFQAIQQQIAVMAEQVASATIAARIGLSGDGFDPLRAAMAKCRVNEAAHQICAIAHAVHGAIGATEEYDLQLFTRRIKQGQLAFGAESYWAERLGRARCAATGETAADFVRLHLNDGETAQ